MPQADEKIITEALNLLYAPTDVIELRALSLRSRKRTDAGYFDAEHRPELIRTAMRLNGKASAVYVNLNPIDPQLHSRYANRMQEGASSTATDANITRRRWLLLDFDPARPKDTSATSSQVEAAHLSARDCHEYLRDEGWPEPVCAHSGNGYHLIYPVDLSNDEASRELIKAVLKSLATRFDSDAVKVDQSVFNAGRIVKLYGTVANKGDHTQLAPWRLSHIIRAPERNAMVSVDQLTAIAPAQSQRLTKPNGASSFDLTGFLSRLDIGFRQDMHEGWERYKLDHCPFNSEHGFGEAAIFRSTAGMLGFRCLHNSCADKGWKDVRGLVDGPGKRYTDPASDADNTEQWQEPLPLIVSHERLPYPIEALSGLLGEAVREVQAFVQCPVALVACSALSVLSVAAQGLVDVERGENLSGPVSLYFLSLAESGERKSSCDKIFSSVLDEWEAKQGEDYRVRIAEHSSKCRAWNAEREGIEAAIREAARKNESTEQLKRDLADHEANPPAALFVPSVKHGDITPEELARSMATGWHSGAILSSEAGVIFGSHGMGAESVMRNVSLLNILWDGGSVKIERKTSPSFVLNGARLTLGLAAQPDTVRAFFESTKGLARGSGFAARFLLGYPESTQGNRLYRENGDLPKTREYLKRIRELLDMAPSINVHGELVPVVLRFSPEAKERWIKYHNEVEIELRANGELTEVRDAASKSADQAARIAAGLHVSVHGASGEISGEHMQAAVQIAKWHLYESRHILGEVALPKNLNNAAKLDSWLIRYCREKNTASVSTRDVQRTGPNCIRGKSDLDQALNELEQAGRVFVRVDGRQKRVMVNPKLLAADVLGPHRHGAE